MGRRPADLSGRKFGMLTAKYATEKRDKRGSVYWHCVCDCGNEVDVTAAGLVHGNYHSCGCLQKKNRQEIAQRRHLVDGTCVEVLEKRKSRKDNMSGFRGVFQLKNCNRYRVDIGFKGKRYYVGLFDNYDEAVQARLAAENLIHNGFIQKWKEWNEKEKEDPEWGKEHAVHFSVRDDGVIRKLAAYVVLGINEDGMKEVLSIVVGENESSKYWLSVLNSLKNRGVQDILILCSDGLTGIKDAISTAFPKTEQQRCIVHMVRNMLKYVTNKDMKAFAKDLKTIYTAASEEAARKQLETVTKKWSGQYPSAMNRWHDNWDAISPIFKFSKDVRTAFYTTNAIESLNSCYRRLNK